MTTGYSPLRRWLRHQRAAEHYAADYVEEPGAVVAYVEAMRLAYEKLQAGLIAPAPQGYWKDPPPRLSPQYWEERLGAEQWEALVAGEDDAAVWKPLPERDARSPKESS